MESFTKNGGDKSDDLAFEKFRKRGKLFKNRLIFIAFSELIAGNINYIVYLF